jgi:CRP/FNR family transcriptional regulator, cyclic AMP receptor protein
LFVGCTAFSDDVRSWIGGFAIRQCAMSTTVPASRGDRASLGLRRPSAAAAGHAMNEAYYQDAPDVPGLKAAGPFDVEAFASRYGGVATFILKAGAALYAQGQPASCLFYVQKGRVRLSVLSAKGKEAIIAVLDAGDFCGEDCLTGERMRVSTANCVTDAIVARLEHSSVGRAIRQDPQFAELYVDYVLHRAALQREQLISQFFDSSEQRLARILLSLTRCGRRTDPVIRTFDQEALAQMVGTTRSRINYFMNKFRTLGYIDYKGDIVVYDTLANAFSHGPAGAAGERAPAPLPKAS